MAECRVELEGYCKVTQQKERTLRMVKNKGLSGSLCLTKTDSSGYLKVFLLEKYKIVLWAYMAFFFICGAKKQEIQVAVHTWKSGA